MRKVIHGQAVKNKDALANPEALDLYAELERTQELINKKVKEAGFPGEAGLFFRQTAGRGLESKRPWAWGAHAPSPRDGK